MNKKDFETIKRNLKYIKSEAGSYNIELCDEIEGILNKDKYNLTNK